MWLGSPSKKTLIAMLMTGAALAAVSIAIYLGGFAAQSHRQTMPFLVGVNLAGAEFGPDKEQDGPRGVFGTEYTYPIADLTPGYESPAYFLAKGMNTFRLPVRWERLQYELGKPLDKDELARLALTVKKLGELDAWVILDLHNFGRYEGTLIGTKEVPLAAFADVWERLAKLFTESPHVIFGLMNEPYGIDSKVWAKGANLAVSAIRKTGARNLIFVGGNSFSSTARWYADGNAEALLGVKDPLDRIVFEGHLYLDARSEGLKKQCVSENIGVNRFKPFLRWLRENNKIGFLGEFGGGRNARCARAISNLAAFIGKNRDVVLGWTYWAAGPWWPVGYFTSIEPEDGRDAPQLKALMPYIVSATGPAIARGYRDSDLRLPKRKGK